MKNYRGFTLVELMVTLLVAVLLLTMGVPAMRGFVMDGRIVGYANEFVASTQLARSVAIKQQRNAQVCVSTTWNNATPTCTGGTDWSAGWVVWVDQDQDAALDTAEVLRVVEPLDGNMTFTSTASTLFTYDATGIVNAGDTLMLCDNRDDEIGRRVVVNAAGRVNLARTGMGCT